jgi:polyhydroxyalkanoate synthesis repressor PhaR
MTVDDESAEASGKGGQGARRVIKKYANRRLYDTGTSSYITLGDLAKMVRDGLDFVVLDAKTGADITHSILSQIILEQQSGGSDPLLPVSFLRELITMYGQSMQTVLPAYLDASMTQFRQNQAKFREAVDKGMGAGAFRQIAETNMTIMRAAAEALMPGSGGSAGAAREHGPGTGGPPKDADEIAALRDQMAAMQDQLDRLDR